MIFYVPRGGDGKFQSFTEASEYFPKTLELMRKLIPTHVVFEGKVGRNIQRTSRNEGSASMPTPLCLRPLRVDMIAFDSADQTIRAYEVKRGNGHLQK
jgi:hypothetical protein